MAVKEWWIAPDGSDGGGLGTESMPFLTVDACVSAGKAGDIVSAKPGIYYNPSNLTKQGMTLRTVGNGMARFHGGGVVSASGVWVPHSGYIWKMLSVADPVSIFCETPRGDWIKGWLKDSLGELVNAYDFFWDSGTSTLYFVSPDGNPSSVFGKIHKPVQTGTASIYTNAGAGIFPFGGIYISATDVALRGVIASGWGGNGILGDDASRLYVDHCNVDLNLEDGGGGFGLNDLTVWGGQATENGRRRGRLLNLADIETRGDGWSTHLGLVESTNFSIKGVFFKKNTKDGVQNIHGSTGTIEECRFEKCCYNLVFNTSGNQTVRNCEIVVDAEDLFGLGLLSTAANISIYNLTIVGPGAGQARWGTQAGIRNLQGTLTVVNTILKGFDNGYLDANGIGVLVEDYNLFHGNTSNALNVSTPISLGAHDKTVDPQFAAAAAKYYQLLSTSPARAAGLDLRASGVTRDIKGRTRPATPCIGAQEYAVDMVQCRAGVF